MELNNLNRVPPTGDRIELTIGALRREKALLERVLELAECQLELIQSDRLEDLEILVRLRETPMSELRMAEVNVGGEMPRIEQGLISSSNEDLEELHHLNLLIISLANQIVEIDERANQLAEQRAFGMAARKTPLKTKRIKNSDVRAENFD